MHVCMYACKNAKHKPKLAVKGYSFGLVTRSISDSTAYHDNHIYNSDCEHTNVRDKAGIGKGAKVDQWKDA